MNFEEFRETISQSDPPLQISAHLLSLWHEAKGDWDRSHQVIQDINDSNAAWIHAYLHRKEGDNWNADYWYSKAGRKRPGKILQEEWEDIVKTLLISGH